MLSAAEFETVTKSIFELLGFNENIEVAPLDEDGVYVSLQNGRAGIGAGTKTLAARGAMLLVLKTRAGITEFVEKQAPHFDTCGVLFDVSSGAAMRVEYIKKYLSYMAALGMNVMYFYMEDMFEMPKYPMFGYMRGRYSLSQLREIDDWAYSMGIEVIPCIETLAHMQHFIKWRDALKYSDAYDTLLCDSDDTYTLIEDMVKTVKTAFRSRKINIGLDESYNMGRFNYYRLHGYVPYQDIFLKHANRVVEICKKHGFNPSMWSDMLFCLNSKIGRYYDHDVEFSDEFKKMIPDAELTYWDYDSTEESHYDIMLQKHKSLGKKVSFAGSVYTFLNFIPSLKRTADATHPAMKMCLRHGIKDVFATVWGGDGAECPLFMSVLGLPLFSEYCYRGLDCTEEDIKTVMKYAVGIEYDYSMLLSGYDNIMGRRNQGREILYGDPFWSPLGKDFDHKTAVKLYGEILDELAGKSCAFDELHSLALLLFEILQKKCPLFYLRDIYQKKDLTKLSLAAKDIDGLIALEKQLWSLHKDIWNKYCKVFGWEIHAARYAHMTARLEYIKQLLLDYTEGKIEVIEELEEKLEDAVPSVPLPIYNRMAYTPFPVA